MRRAYCSRHGRQSGGNSATNSTTRFPCEQGGIDLIATDPTMLAGIVAATGYIKNQMKDDGTCMAHEIIFEYSPGAEGE